VRYLLFGLLLLGEALWAAPRQLDDYRWDGIERIVAVGDLHGDHANYMATLRAARLVDGRGRWTGGAAHLVQTGDIADRGPDTRRIMTHLARLSREAERRGGRVHALLGNHEAMNVLGDLRYVDPGEFAAFADRRSQERRARYFQAMMESLRRSDPERHAALPRDFRAQWERDHPLGWVEHRLAWDPRLDSQGELFRWTLRTKVAVQLNDLLFVHGGISGAYCGNSLASLSVLAHAALRRADPEQAGILADERGPLWYRGLAGAAPATPPGMVDAILARHGARRIVVGHTPTGGVVWPRQDGRVILIDTGIGGAYGGRIGWLEVTPDGLYAGHPGGRVPLPADDAGRAGYLDAVIALQPDNVALRERRVALLAGGDAPAVPEAEDRAITGGTPAREPVSCDTAR
jgi:3',5'-cyclic AMP phosphodiesterase CpdA